MAFSLAQLFDRMDRLPESIVMNTVQDMYNSGRRGIFSEKFMPYSDIKELGYRSFKCIVQGLYELDPNFVRHNSDELEDLLDKAVALTAKVQSGEVDLTRLTEVENHKSQITNQGELQYDTGIGQLDDQFGRDLYS